MSATVASDAPVSDAPRPGAHPPDATASGSAIQDGIGGHPFEKYLPAQHPVGVRT